MDSNKKIRLTKSQFNKNVKYELQNLNNLRKNNVTSTVTFKNPSSVVQCPSNNSSSDNVQSISILSVGHSAILVHRQFFGKI